MTESEQPRKKAGIAQVAKIMLSALVMVGKRDAWHKEGAVTMAQVIVGAVIAAVLIIGALILLVHVATG